MLKIIYEILINPLTLPINPIWEYFILIVLGEVAHEIAFYVSPGGKYGSIIYWVTKIPCFFIIWLVTYILIVVIQFFVANWIWCLIISIILTSLIIIIYYLVMKHKKKNIHT